ncbi:MAG: MarR family transcriptional regulator [Methanobacterium sp.]|nr:MarR family transcriptional regulator [Methanobacterium sp.]
MNDQEFKTLVDNLLIYYPLFYRRIKTSINQVNSKYCKSEGYYQIIGLLLNTGPLSTSEAGEKLYISKPNMTPLIDKLVQEKMVKRTRSQHDRRVVYIEITEEGKKFLYDAREAVEKNIKENLSNFDEKDLKKLYDSLEKIKEAAIKISK